MPEHRIWTPINLPLYAPYCALSARATSVLWEAWAAVNRRKNRQLDADVRALARNGVGGAYKPNVLTKLLAEIEAVGLLRVVGGQIELCSDPEGFSEADKSDHFQPAPPLAEADDDPTSSPDVAHFQPTSGRDVAAFVPRSCPDVSPVVPCSGPVCSDESNDSNDIGPKDGGIQVQVQVHVQGSPPPVGEEETRGCARATPAAGPPREGPPDGAPRGSPQPARQPDPLARLPDGTRVTPEVWAAYADAIDAANGAGHGFALRDFTPGNLHAVLQAHPSVDALAAVARLRTDLTGKLRPGRGRAGEIGDGTENFRRICEWTTRDGGHVRAPRDADGRGQAAGQPLSRRHQAIERMQAGFVPVDERAAADDGPLSDAENDELWARFQVPGKA